MPAEIPLLLKYLPFAMVAVDRNGGASIGNDRFDRDFGPNLMGQPAIRNLARAATPDWKDVEIIAGGKQKKTLARVFEIDSQLTMVFDNEGDPKLREELDQLHEKFVRLERLSATDVLTGVWNRLHFERVLALESERSNRQKQPVSLIIADIDHFKRINDLHGHQVGDSLLRELVKVMQLSIRSTDMLFRWGGEEFAVIAPASGYRAAAVTAERIRANVEAHRFDVVGHVTVSLGVAEHEGIEASATWFQRTDSALYVAKNEGRNRIFVDKRGNSDRWLTEKGLSVIRLEWQEAYGSGNPTFDEEHCRLFELGNEMLDATFKAETKPQAFRSKFDELTCFIETHFQVEERALEEIGYAELAIAQETTPGADEARQSIKIRIRRRKGLARHIGRLHGQQRHRASYVQGGSEILSPLCAERDKLP